MQSAIMSKENESNHGAPEDFLKKGPFILHPCHIEVTTPGRTLMTVITQLSKRHTSASECDYDREACIFCKSSDKSKYV